MTARESLAQTVYYIPHVIDGSIGDGRRYQTEFVVTNPSPTAVVNVVVSLKNHDGTALDRLTDARNTQDFASVSYTLNPRSGTIFPKTGSRRPAVAGWARIDASGPLNVSAILETWLPTGVRESSVVLPARPGFQQFISQAHVNTIGSIGLAILNPSATDTATIEISLFGDLDPVNPVSSRTIALPPQTNIAQFLDQDGYLNNLLPRNTSGQLFNGVLQVTSSAPIAAALIWVQGTSWLYSPVF
jgi:hypothetical protein